MTVVSIPEVVPRREAYSITIASRGTLPVLSPMPRREQFTADAPYSQAVAAFTTPL